MAVVLVQWVVFIYIVFGGVDVEEVAVFGDFGLALFVEVGSVFVLGFDGVFFIGIQVFQGFIEMDDGVVINKIVGQFEVVLFVQYIVIGVDVVVVGIGKFYGG